MQKDIPNIRIEDYNYELPDERIAKYPLPQRDASKLLMNRNGELSEHRFGELADLLPVDSLLVFNNTKVIQARMYFRKETGAQIEIFCLEPHSPHDYVLSFQQNESCEWKCMIGNAKRWKNGTLNTTLVGKKMGLQLYAERISTEGNTHVIRFSWDNQAWTFADILETFGELPIPPYLHRETCDADKLSYQTVYSKIKGSVAAPTAGLHFSAKVFDALNKKGVETEEITLHVGAGTFQPVKSDEIKDHSMHSELFTVERKTIEHLLQKLGSVVAVGTTSVRTLESLYYIGVLLKQQTAIDHLHITQWLPYEIDEGLTPKKALQNILFYLEKNKLEYLQASTQIIIASGYQFRIVDGIITNFHQPKSTLLLLISAYLGEDWKSMYDYALANDFRFLSYGDSSLLMREKG